jgi:phosphoribosylformylglycinamidine synthase subunit PurSL
VPAGSRLTIQTIGDDPREAAIAAAAAANHLDLPGPVRVSDIAFVEGDLDDDQRRRLADFLADPLLQTATWQVPGDTGRAVEIAFHPGVTDAAADAIIHAAAQLGVPVTAAATGQRIEFPPGCDDATIDALLRRVIANAVIERWVPRRIEPVFHPGSHDAPVTETIPLRGLDAAGLEALNTARSLALDEQELIAIRDHFTARGRDPSDVELETLAQTWSEHCAHKSFRAAITVDGTEVTPLLRQLRDTTERIGAKFVRSAFVGNAGIVSFTEGETLALKAETHNHPSAVEPFGGANTGVGGVIRDVLGAGHRPIAVTDVLCFGPADLAPETLPDGTLHPQRIRQGVVAGVADYGNKIGLPTVAGAVLYDQEFTTNPLVFCGCIGRAADREPANGPYPGDRIIVIGGATGRDGIRGATFSSAAMDASTGEVAGASVQIGDPVTEKLLIDVLDGAEGLWTAITDCGAGGLSSAIGEMAEVLGADVELDAVPLKYPGLQPWEIWLSEAQERMVLAVAPADVDELRRRCQLHRVDASDLGEFTGTGQLVVRSGGEPVLDLPTSFLHDGRPQRQMVASATAAPTGPAGRRVDDPRTTLLALLAHPNIASKADVVQRYDHEIGGATLVRPLAGRGDQGHADGVVLAHPEEDHGVAIGIGVNPWYGFHDPAAMATVAVDEAIRNVVAVGADPDRVALLDNFSWGDPRDPSTLGALVAAVAGCCAAAEAFDAPFVSGKDSLNNTYSGSDGERHAVPPTLVITAVAHVPEVSRCITPELVAPGNVLVLLGDTGEHFAGSHLDLLTGAHRAPGPGSGTAPRLDAASPARYRTLHQAIRAGLVAACHDVSEGGLAVALAEMCIAAQLGARINSLPHSDVSAALFSESAGRLVVEVAASDVEAVSAIIGPAHVLGTVTAQPVFTIDGVFEVDLGELTTAFAGKSW